MAELTRVAAVGAAACASGGMAAVTVAVLAGPGPGLTGYVSEAGVTSSGYAPTYRLGVFALAMALLLLTVALPRAVHPAPALLATAGLGTAVSGAVTCSDGCPLPPFERPTVADLVHGAASLAAVATAVCAMLVISLARMAGRSLRLLATTGAAVALPLAVAVGLAMLTAGRGPVVGALERLLLADVIAWGVATAIAVAASREPRRQ